MVAHSDGAAIDGAGTFRRRREALAIGSNREIKARRVELLAGLVLLQFVQPHSAHDSRSILEGQCAVCVALWLAVERDVKGRSAIVAERDSGGEGRSIREHAHDFHSTHLATPSQGSTPSSRFEFPDIPIARAAGN